MKNKHTFIAICIILGIPLAIWIYLIIFFNIKTGYWVKDGNVCLGYVSIKSSPMHQVDTLKEADAATFRILDFYWAKDCRNVYHRKTKTTYDVASFEFLEKEFVRDSSGTFFHPNTPYVEIESGWRADEVDIPSFEWLDEISGWAKDSCRIYKMWKYSHIISGSVVQCREGSWSYLKDSLYVYSNDGILENADPETFVVLRDSRYIFDGYYGKDINQVYYQGNIIPEADPESFTLLDDNFSEDGNHIFYDGQITLIRRMEDIEQIGSFYKDSLHVYGYNLMSILEGADPKTFSKFTNDYEFLSGYLKKVDRKWTGVYRDACHVYHRDDRKNETLRLADPDSLVYLHIGFENYAFDRHGTYMFTHEDDSFMEFIDWALTSGEAPQNIVDAIPEKYRR